MKEIIQFIGCTFAFGLALIIAFASIAIGIKASAIILESDADRGCVASAYQAQRYGHDLESNLAYCDKLRMAE